MRRALLLLSAICLATARAAAAGSTFDLSYQIENSSKSFSPNQVQILTSALVHAETAWETVITGYAPTAAISPLVIHVWPTNEGLAAATHNGTTSQGGFTFSTGGNIFVNYNEIENFANWQGHGATGLNYIDELLVHETGHVLGVGTLWTSNGLYVPGTFHYTGAFGLAAYRTEFDPAAAFVPVENAGEGGTAGAHWNQLMRSSVLEGNPDDYWSLDPRVGRVDAFGRDMGLEVMTGAIDPDYGEPFFSRLTVESMRDLGYTTTKFEDANGDGAVTGADLAIWKANFGATGLQIDSFAFGDADRDRAVAGRDFLLWQRAFGGGSAVMAVPEPMSAITDLIACALVLGGFVSSRRARVHQTV